jgi:hypothetical protein
LSHQHNNPHLTNVSWLTPHIWACYNLKSGLTCTPQEKEKDWSKKRNTLDKNINIRQKEKKERPSFEHEIEKEKQPLTIFTSFGINVMSGNTSITGWRAKIQIFEFSVREGWFGFSLFLSFSLSLSLSLFNWVKTFFEDDISSRRCHNGSDIRIRCTIRHLGKTESDKNQTHSVSIFVGSKHTVIRMEWFVFSSLCRDILFIETKLPRIDIEFCNKFVSFFKDG